MTELSKANILHTLRNLKNPQVMLSATEVNQEVASQIPKEWLSLLSLGEIDFDKLQELWHPVGDNISTVMEELERTIQGLAILIEDNQQPSLLYIFLGNEKLYYHRGFPPLKDDDIPREIANIWGNLPLDFRDLYTIHNGWVSLHSKSMGHLPADKLSLLCWEEWSLEAEVIESTPINPEKTVIVFTNGGSGYLGFELSDLKGASEAKPLIWWSNKPSQPELNIEFWSVFNTWISMDFADMDSVI